MKLILIQHTDYFADHHHHKKKTQNEMIDSLKIQSDHYFKLLINTIIKYLRSYKL